MADMSSARNTRRLFPLKTVGDVCELFRSQLRPDRRPNLAQLSLVTGLIEAGLTCNRDPIGGGGVGGDDDDLMDSDGRIKHADDPYGVSPIGFGGGGSGHVSAASIPIPHITWPMVDALHHKFVTQIKGSVDLSLYPKRTTRDLIKKISDVIWSHLSRTYYKDRAHLQTIYSYLTGNKLDCFGVAYAVVAACQVLGLDDVQLALSEDHAWVIFGPDGETCEVTWHGKGNEDKRGQPVATNTDSWLYLNGHRIVCSRYMTIAALVSAMNPSINATNESEELAILQKELLWCLYDYGHLATYPMAIGNLGDLEDICPSLTPRKSPVELFYEAIQVAKRVYADHHVYPYTYLAGYLYRNGRFKEALKSWADAAQVVKQYNYTRDDEEIYKEFLEIANELIPHMVRVVSAGGLEPSGMSARPLLQDPECFASLLRFYDGLCGWEEGSSTPVLHIGWAKPLVATISKFPHYIRSKVDIKADDKPENDDRVDSDSDDDNDDDDDNDVMDRDVTKQSTKQQIRDESNVSSTTTTTTSAAAVTTTTTKSCDTTTTANNNNSKQQTSLKRNGSVDDSQQSGRLVDIDESDIQSDASLGQSESELIKSLVKDMDATGEPNPTIAALAAACSENILNPRFLLGQDIENAFTNTPPSGTASAPTSSTENSESSTTTTATTTPATAATTTEPAVKVTEPSKQVSTDSSQKTVAKEDKPSVKTGSTTHTVTSGGGHHYEKTLVTLTSHKFAGLKHLLLADKLNTSAIQLQLTAQSQVDTKKRYRHSATFKGSLMGGPEFDFVATTTTTLSRTSKRIRRE
ncbi:menin-like [Oppia nitens]|uniref:menin-like n=1 Tax=Oppia nitens TaxID=1686743 RepID=UPI0023DC6145|nr:menin-like [Oppia nitens]